MVLLLAIGLTLSQNPVTLDSLEAAKKEVKSGSGVFSDVSSTRKINDGVLQLLKDDKLKSGSDFQRASALYTVLNWSFDDARVRYELTLTAFALGDTDAEGALSMDWDSLLITTGRHQRFGTLKVPPEIASTKFSVDPAPSLVVKVLRAPAKAKDAAKAVGDNPKLQETVDADQNDRQGEPSKLKTEDVFAMMRRDRERMARVKAAVDKGELRTAQDFFNAALVLQHGEVAGDYALAHELCLCAVALGDAKDGRWLAAASYDRMMRNLGHHQRFATQYDAEGLQKVDTDGINDTMRKALHCPTLEVARKRVFK